MPLPGTGTPIRECPLDCCGRSGFIDRAAGLFGDPKKHGFSLFPRAQGQ